MVWPIGRVSRTPARSACREPRPSDGALRVLPPCMTRSTHLCWQLHVRRTKLSGMATASHTSQMSIPKSSAGKTGMRAWSLESSTTIPARFLSSHSGSAGRRTHRSKYHRLANQAAPALHLTPHLATGARRRGPTPHRQGAAPLARPGWGSRLEDDHSSMPGDHVKRTITTYSPGPF